MGCQSVVRAAIGVRVPNILLELMELWPQLFSSQQLHELIPADQVEAHLQRHVKKKLKSKCGSDLVQEVVWAETPGLHSVKATAFTPTSPPSPHPFLLPTVMSSTFLQ